MTRVTENLYRHDDREVLRKGKTLSCSLIVAFKVYTKSFYSFSFSLDLKRPGKKKKVNFANIKEKENLVQVKYR